MNSAQRDQQEIAALYGHRTGILTTAPYAATRGMNSDPEENVRYACWIVLPIPRKEDGRTDAPFFPGARAWCQMRSSKIAHSSVFFFQLLLLLAEKCNREGSVRPVHGRASGERHYQSVCELVARQRKGYLTDKRQIAALRTAVKCDHYYDPQFLKDVEEAEKKVEEDMKRKHAAKNKKRGAEQPAQPPPDEGPPIVNPEEPQFEVRQVEMPMQKPRPKCGADGTSWLKMLQFDRKRTLRLEVSEECREAYTKSLPHLGYDVAYTYKKGKMICNVMQAVIQNEEQAHAEGLQEKIRFTVTAMPRKDDANEIACLVCTFVIRDPNIDPSAFFGKILDNLQYRQERLRASSTAQRQKMATNPEMFPEYTALYHTHHPAGNLTSPEVYFRCAMTIRSDLASAPGSDMGHLYRRHMMDLLNMNNPFHVRNLLSVERAVVAIREAGADPGTRDTWWNPYNRRVQFPEHARTYKFHPQQVFWKHPRLIALSDQYFPHINAKSDFLSCLLSGGNFERFLKEDRENEALDAAQVDFDLTAAGSYMDQMWAVDKSLANGENLVPYDTNNEFVHRAAERDRFYKRIKAEYPPHYAKTLRRVQELVAHYGQKDWRFHLSAEEKEHVRACERYNLMVKTAQDACMQIFSSLCQLDGEVDHLPIPAPIRAILKWYSTKHAHKFPNVTREFIMFDPQLRFFGNSMLRTLKLFGCVAQALQPLICMLWESMFSAYYWNPNKLASNILASGRHDTGKTFLGITVPKKMSIEGTIEEFTASTPAANTTKRHKYDIILCCDEVSQHKVSEKEALKNPDRVNEDKMILSTKQLGKSVFVNMVGPDGQNVRWNELVTTDHHCARFEATNAIVQKENPLMSRYFHIVVPQARIPAREFSSETALAMLDEDTVISFQMAQFLSALTYKGMQVGALLPAPELKIFKDISNKVIDFLVAKSAIKDTGARPLEVMEPYMVQLINRMALHYTFDLPSSPYYRKKFELSMLQHVQYYQYATVEMCWWIWTAMAAQWVDDKNTNVIMAVRRLACSKWIEEFSAYGNYEIDINNEIPWRLRRNPNYNPDRCPKGDEWLVDINYITLTGTLEKIAHEIADHTNPSLDYTDVIGALKHMQNTPVSMPAGGYKHQPRETFSKWHKYVVLPKWDADGKLVAEGVKHVDMQSLATQYLLDDNEDNGSTKRDERHVPKMGPGTTAHVVDMSDLYSEKKLHIMPHVDGCFRNSLIIKALISATMCGSFPEGKMILGFPDDADPMQMQVFECDDAKKEHFMNLFDAQYGWRFDRHNNSLEYGWKKKNKQWVPLPENEHAAPDYRTPSRREGVTFPRRGAIDDKDRIILSAVPLAPCTEEDRGRKIARIEAEISQMNQLAETIADLDAHSATARHMACGRPLDEPVRTPQWIMQQYREACQRTGRAQHMNVDYPREWRKLLLHKKNKWDSARPTKRDMAVLDHDEAFELCMTNLSHSDAMDMQAARHATEAARPAGSISKVAAHVLLRGSSTEVPLVPPPPPAAAAPAPSVRRKKAQLQKKRQRPIAVPLYDQ